MELSSGCEKLKTATCDKFETFARLCITSNQFIVLNCLLDAIIIWNYAKLHAVFHVKDLLYLLSWRLF